MRIFSKFKKIVSFVLVLVIFTFACGGCQNLKQGSSKSESSSSKESSVSKDVVLKYKNYEVSLDEYMCILTSYLELLCEVGSEIKSQENSMAIHKYSLQEAKRSAIFREKLQGVEKDLTEECKKTIEASVDEGFSNRSFSEDSAKSLAITKKGLKEYKKFLARNSIMVDEGFQNVDESYKGEIDDDGTIINFDALDLIDVFSQAKVVLDIVKQKSDSGQKCKYLEDLLAP